MTSKALQKLLHKKQPPRAVTWIKVDRRRAYVHLKVPPCFVCGRPDAPVVWFNCKTGGVRCLGCRDDEKQSLLP